MNDDFKCQLVTEPVLELLMQEIVCGPQSSHYTNYDMREALDKFGDHPVGSCVLAHASMHHGDIKWAPSQMNDRE
jgi:hypothetical protein